MGQHWTTVDEQLGIYKAEYPFNGTLINTLAFRVPDGMLVVSPGIDPAPALLDELDAIGPVVAIASPGAFHHLGMPAWKERYPSVPFFATSSGLTHIAKQHKGLDLGLQGLDALRPMLPDHITLEETPGAKHPDLLAFIRSDDGSWSWFTNEILGNQPTLPANFLVRTVFKLTKAGPGLKVPTPVLWLIGAKKPVMREYLLKQLIERPPARLIPCHGDVLAAPDLAERMRVEFEAKF